MGPLTFESTGGWATDTTRKLLSHIMRLDIAQDICCQHCQGGVPPQRSAPNGRSQGEAPCNLGLCSERMHEQTLKGNSGPRPLKSRSVQASRLRSRQSANGSYPDVSRVLDQAPKVHLNDPPRPFPIQVT